MPGPNQHYLPAAVIGGFAATPAPKLRESLVWVARRGVERVFQKKAEGVGALEHLYTLRPDEGHSDPYFVDGYWSRIEPQLPGAIDAIISTTITPLSAALWADIVVPFAAHMFTRGIDFEKRLRSKLGPLNAVADQDPNFINLFRMRETQTMLTAVLLSEWTVLHTSEAHPFVINDAGRIGMWHLPSGTSGYVIPLRRDAVLVLTRGPRRPQLTSDDQDRWILAGVRHLDLAPKHVPGLNAALARGALVEVYGPHEALLDGLRAEMGDAPHPAQFGAEAIIQRDSVLRQHMTMYLSLLTFLGRPPSTKPGPVTEIDWQRVARILPAAFVPIPVPDSPDIRALQREGRERFRAEVHASMLVPLQPGIEPRPVMEFAAYEPSRRDRRRIRSSR